MSAPLNCIFLAGVGGTLPTVSRLASTYVTDPSTPMPELGLLFGLGLFFIIGSVLTYAFSESNIRQAFIIGVCAPGIITNIVAGVQDARIKEVSNVSYSFFPNVYAQEAIASSPFISYQYVDPILILSNRVVTGSDWDERRTPYMVAAILDNGSFVPLGSFPSASFSQELRIPQGSKGLELRVGNYSYLVDLPEKPYSSIRVTSSIVYTGGKNDFVWAMGGKRESIIRSFSAEVSEINSIDDSVSVKSMLGKKIIVDLSGVNGILEDVKITPDGRVGKFILTTSSGESVYLAPISIKVSESEIRVTTLKDNP